MQSTAQALQKYQPAGEISAPLNAAVPSCISQCSLLFQLLQVSCGNATAVRYTSGKQEDAQTLTSEMPHHWTQKQRDLLQRFARLPLHRTTLHCFCASIQCWHTCLYSCLPC